MDELSDGMLEAAAPRVTSVRGPALDEALAAMTEEARGVASIARRGVLAVLKGQGRTRDALAAEALTRAAFAANARELLAHLERRVLPREEAADVLGETMVAAWCRAARLPADPRAARLRLFALAREAREARDGRGREPQHRLAAAERVRGLISGDVAGEALQPLGASRERSVRAAIGALPAELAELVRLVHWDGFGLGEAAAVLRMPAGQASARYARARALLAAEPGHEVTPNTRAPSTGA